MKRVFIKVCLIILLIIGCLCTKAYAKTDYKNVSKNIMGAVKVDKSIIYAEDSLKSKKLKKVYFGDKVVIKKESNNWYKVIFNKTKGYIKTDDIVKYNKTKKQVALTFDDGPSITTTPIVLNALEKNGCRATFFVVGNRINSRTGKLLKRETKLGCEVGNHSYSHPNLAKLTSSQISSQLNKTDKAIKNYIGTKPRLVRVPYGSYNKTVLSKIKGTSVLWSVDTLDWKYRNTNRLISYVTKNAKNNDIVLMHDIHATTARAVDQICKNLRKKNFETVTVTEILAIKK